MRGERLFYLFLLGSAFILSGCVARTYTITRERIDQDLTKGNRGYIMGKATEETEGQKKEDRAIRVFEMEFGKPYQTKQVNPPKEVESQATETATSDLSETETTAEPAVTLEPTTLSASGEKYTVEKNDTLQKISKKFYGTTKKWMKIYKANQDVLSSPNKLYSGQVLNIPESAETKTESQSLIEPKENLK